MESVFKIGELHTTLRNIESLSEKILSKGLEMMKDIVTDDSEIIEEISDQLDDLSDSEIVEKVQDYLNSLIKDAEIVHQEIGEFAKAVVQGDEAVYKISSLFFQQIWHGDMYDKDHIEGLKALCGDLQNQLGLLTGDNIVGTVVFRVNDNNSDSDSQ